MVLNSIKRASEILGKRGFFSLLKSVLRKFGSLFFFKHTSIWLSKNLAEKDLSSKGFEDFEIVMNDLEGICAWMEEKNAEFPWMYSEKEVLLAKQFNHIIPHVKHKNKIIGYTKVALNGVFIRDYNSIFPLAPNKAMFYDTTILPEYRGKRLSFFLRSRIFPYLKEKNIEYIYAHIEPWNKASIKANERAGFKQVFINRFIRVLGFKFHSNNPRKFLI